MGCTAKTSIPTPHKTCSSQMQFSGSGTRNSFPVEADKWRITSEGIDDCLAPFLCRVQQPLRCADGNPVTEASLDHRRGKRLPARSHFPRHGYARASGARKWIVDHNDPYRHRSVDKEKTRVQRQESE